MPINRKVATLRSPFRDRRGENPCTRVRDLNDAVKVEVLAGPSSQQLAAIKEFAHVAFVENYLGAEQYENEATIASVLDGASLAQCAEPIHFDLRVTGVTRIFTHQLVRQRVGITFSQQCSGDKDWRHHDALIPRIFPAFRNRIVNLALRAKCEYTQLVNSGVSVQEARYLLPHCLETAINVHASLGILAALYAKRVCTMTQTWEMILFANRMRAALWQKYPEVTKLFVHPCLQSRCWYQRVKDNGFSCVHLFAPDKVHDNFDWDPNSFAHRALTHEQLSNVGAPVETQHFIDDECVGQETWESRMHDYHA